MAFLHKPVYLSTLVVLRPLGLKQGGDAAMDDFSDASAKHHAENVTTLETCKTNLTAAVSRAVAGEL